MRLVRLGWLGEGWAKEVGFLWVFFAEVLLTLKSLERQDTACVCVAGVYLAASLPA